LPNRLAKLVLGVTFAQPGEPIIASAVFPAG
jgi:hypothetical protein